MAITLPVENEVETTVSYATVMTASLALIETAERYAAEGMSKGYTLECLVEIARALVELEWNTQTVQRLIDEVSQREF
jgi:hypothetical protein